MKARFPFTKYIRSYGVVIRLESDTADFLEGALRSSFRALVGEVTVVPEVETVHSYSFFSGESGVFLSIDGEEIPARANMEEVLPFFESMLRIKVAEYAEDRIFLHAGVVGWRDKAIIYPADSFGGKSTLTAAFVKCGATYYSDDYAVLDGKGLVHPFARPISMREAKPNGYFDRWEIDAESLGGKRGETGIPVGAVWITRYEPSARWAPRLLTPGEAVMEMISQTIPIRYKPEFALKVLKKITSDAILLKCARNDAGDFARRFLDFVDNKAF